MANDLKGGYIYNFIDIPDEYNCAICLCVLRNPVQVECGHRFCKTCFSDVALDSLYQVECPLDRTKLSLSKVFPDAAAQRFILSSKVKCSDHADGCNWIGEFHLFESHKEECHHSRLKDSKFEDVLDEVKKIKLENVIKSDQIANLEKEVDASKEEIKALSEKVDAFIKENKKDNLKERENIKSVGDSNSIITIGSKNEWRYPKFSDRCEHFSPPLYHKQFCFQLSIGKCIEGHLWMSLYRCRGKFDDQDKSRFINNNFSSFSLKVLLKGQKGVCKKINFMKNNWTIGRGFERSNSEDHPINGSDLVVNGYYHIEYEFCIKN